MRKKRSRRRKTNPAAERGARRGKLAAYALAFACGATLAGGLMLLAFPEGGPPGALKCDARTEAAATDNGPNRRTNRTVAQLIALRDEELERTDIVEMNIAVAREIPGLEKLDYGRYRGIVDGWTDRFRFWLMTVEPAFHKTPARWKNDLAFFRMGMLAQFLDEQIGVAYVKEHKASLMRDRKAGRKPQILYTNPGHLLLHGLLDTRQGTCASLPTLQVAIGRRMGWPVALACVGSHYVCRYDDGKKVHNIETTDTGRGGFAETTDKEYIAEKQTSRRAVACGSDLRKLSAREMLGVFVAMRARHYCDVNQIRRSARDYALAYTLFPSSRKIYIGVVGNMVPRGFELFTPDEHGHPDSLAAFIRGLHGGI